MSPRHLPRWVAPTGWLAVGLAMIVLAEQAVAHPSRALLVADVVGGAVFLAAGLAVRSARPGNRCWWLLMACGTSWFVGTLAASADRDLALVGFAFGGWYFVALSWLVLAYPTGRVQGSGARVLLLVIAALFVVRTTSRLFLFVAPDGTGCDCVTNRFLPVSDPRWYDAVDRVFPWAFVAAFAGVSVLAGVRWLRSSRPGRRMLTPMVVAVAAVALQLAYDYVITDYVTLTSARRQDLFFVVVAGRAVIAAAFVVGLLRLRSARSAVVDVVSGLEGYDATPDDLAPALRRGLGDSSLELVPWSAAAGAFVHASGQRVELPVQRAGRAGTVIENNGKPVAVLLHDEALLEDPGLVSAITATVRLTADNDRLRRELQEQLAEVAASRSRLVAAGDAERSRIERDLHDGAQQRLVTIALSLGLTESRLAPDTDPTVLDAIRQSVKDLAEAIAELRDLARGIHPAVLTESGLATALGSLADRSPVPVRLDVRLPTEPTAPVAAAAYFAVAEALTNVAKHARATEAVVDVVAEDGRLLLRVTDDGVGGADPAAGTGLRGLADRVDAAGGALTVSGASGDGTVLVVELPCG